MEGKGMVPWLPLPRQHPMRLGAPNKNHKSPWLSLQSGKAWAGQWWVASLIEGWDPSWATKKKGLMGILVLKIYMDPYVWLV